MEALILVVLLLLLMWTWRADVRAWRWYGRAMERLPPSSIPQGERPLPQQRTLPFIWWPNIPGVWTKVPGWRTRFRRALAGCQHPAKNSWPL